MVLGIGVGEASLSRALSEEYKGQGFFLKEIMRNTKAREFRGLWGAGMTQSGCPQ